MLNIWFNVVHVFSVVNDSSVFWRNVRKYQGRKRKVGRAEKKEKKNTRLNEQVVKVETQETTRLIVQSDFIVKYSAAIIKD